MGKHIKLNEIMRLLHYNLYCPALLWLFILTITIHNAAAQSPGLARYSANNPSLHGNGMQFTENKGQIADMNQRLRPEILYKGNGGGTTVYLRKTGVSYVLSNNTEAMHEVQEEIEELKKKEGLSDTQLMQKRNELAENQTLKTHRVDVDFAGSNTNCDVITADQVDGYSNYYYPHCKEGVTHVFSYNDITFKNIYNNIDVRYYGGKEKGLKYDIIINPGGAPQQIKLKYSGVDELKIKNGRLKIQTSLGFLGEYMPRVYQNINGKIIDVRAGYKLDVRYETRDMRQENAQPENSHISDLTSQIYEVSFDLGTWNHSFPLIIDPWVTYFGGNGGDGTSAVAVDPATGNPVVAGWTNSAGLFPVSAGAFQTTMSLGSGSGTYDVFFAKLDAATSNRIYATYVGGSGYDNGADIACDATGNIYVGGYTQSADFPVGTPTAGNVSYKPTLTPCGGCAMQNAFLMKFNSAGARLWGTYYGGSTGVFSMGALSGTAMGQGVTVDAANNVYLSGITTATDMIATAGAFQTTLAAVGQNSDAFVVKFSPNGTRLWGSYVAGLNDSGGIDCDASGNPFIGGQVKSTFPASPAAYQTVGGSAGIFKFDPNGQRLWATFYGGGLESDIAAIATDPSGNVLLFGSTQSATGIATAGAYQPALIGVSNLFIVKFNAAGNIKWGTYLGRGLGGGYHELAAGLATDKDDNVYIYGEWEDNSNSLNYPISACAYQTNHGGTNDDAGEDDFLTRYDPNGKQLCFSYMGGTGQDEISTEDDFAGIAVYKNFLYITGLASTGGYPVTPGAFQTTYNGTDGIVGQLCINLCEAKILGLNFTSNISTVCTNSSVTFTPSINNACDTTGYKFEWKFPGGSPSSSTAVKPTVKYYGAGTYSAQLKVITPCKTDSIIKPSSITVNSCACIVSASAAVTANVSCSSTGSANVTISNGSGGIYTYSWSNGSSGTTTATVIPVTGLSAGTYSVTVTDGTCATVSTVQLTQALNTSSITPTNIACNGSASGKATVIISGGSVPYTYNWSNGVSTITNSLTSQLSNITAGTYTVTITNGSCILTSTVAITEPPAMTMTFSKQLPCTANSGTATVTPANGSSPYLYAWSNSQTTQTATGLAPGNYSVTVTDQNGCTSSQVINMLQPQLPAIKSSTLTNISCTTSGNIYLGTDGAFPLTYNWSNGYTDVSTAPFGSYATTNVSCATAGVYTVTVTDGNGCTTSGAYTITGTSPVSATFTNPTPCAGVKVCFTNTGSAGTETWTWADQANTTGTITNYCTTFLSAGTYSITHTVASGGCTNTITKNAIVINCSAPTVTATPGTVCAGSCTTVTSTGSGGTTPYVYSWSTGATTQNITACPGSTSTYTVKITDAGGTTATTTTIVNVNPAVNVNTTSVTGCSANNGSATANPGGGTVSYTYTWSNSQTTQTATGLAQGNYTVTVTDNKGCSAVSSTSISPSLSAQFIKGTSNCTGCGCKEWIMITAKDGTNPYSYSWPGGTDKRYMNQLCPGNYVIQVTDKNGCNINIAVNTP
jgi:PKD repeat protein